MGQGENQRAETHRAHLAPQHRRQAGLQDGAEQELLGQARFQRDPDEAEPAIAQARASAEGCRARDLLQAGGHHRQQRSEDQSQHQQGGQKPGFPARAANSGASRAPEGGEQQRRQGHVNDQLGAQDQHLLLRPWRQQAPHEGHAVAQEPHGIDRQERQDRAQFQRRPLDQDRGRPRRGSATQATPENASLKMPSEISGNVQSAPLTAR